MKPFSWPNPVILAISCEITQNIANFSLKIKKNGENCHSRILWFTQMVKREITLTLDSHFLSIILITGLDFYSTILEVVTRENADLLHKW